MTKPMMYESGVCVEYVRLIEKNQKAKDQSFKASLNKKSKAAENKELLEELLKKKAYDLEL